MEVEDEAGVVEGDVEAEAEEDIGMVLLPLQRPVLKEPPRRWMARFFKPTRKGAVPISLTTPKKIGGIHGEVHQGRGRKGQSQGYGPGSQGSRPKGT
eukprot:scaffold11225_cov142-Cylindrotheca_fusiformis.AAC.1